MLTEVTGPLLGGIGIFFVGAAMVGQNLKKMTSRKLRMLFAKFTSRDWQSSLIGFASGIITQSTSVSTFIMAGLSASGLIKVRNALPVTFWANAGCSTLVVIAVMDIKYLVFLLLFISGVSVAFDKPYRYRFLARAIFGVAMLFFGLQLVQQGAAPLAEQPWVRELLSASHGSVLLTFFLGAIMTIVTQSFIGVILIAITMTKAGLFSVEQIIMLVYGMELGSSVVTLFLSSGARGTAKQLVMSQVVFNIMAVAIMVVLFYIESIFGIPMVKAAIKSTSQDMGRQVAFLVMLYNFGIPILASFVYGPIEKFLNRFWPPTQEEALAKIKFIKDHSQDSPGAALLMVEKELLRLVNRLPAYMEGVSGAVDGKVAARNSKPYHLAFKNISREIGYTLGDISGQGLDEDTSARLLRLLNIQELLISLERNVVSFCDTVCVAGKSETVKRFATVIVESLEFLLMQAGDAVAGGDADDIAILQTMTSDSGSMVEKIRKQYLEAEAGMNLDDKVSLHRVSALFERTAWLLNRLSTVVGNADHAEEKLA